MLLICEHKSWLLLPSLLHAHPLTDDTHTLPLPMASWGNSAITYGGFLRPSVRFKALLFLTDFFKKKGNYDVNRRYSLKWGCSCYFTSCKFPIEDILCREAVCISDFSWKCLRCLHVGPCLRACLLGNLRVASNLQNLDVMSYDLTHLNAVEWWSWSKTTIEQRQCLRWGQIWKFNRLMSYGIRF